jgi:hypothetical protein
MTEEPGVGTPEPEKDDGLDPGTPEPSKDGGAVPESVPDVERLKADVERLSRLHDEHLREKTNLEDERRQIREVLAAQGHQQPSASQAQALQSMIARLNQDANDPENILAPYAQMNLALMQELYNTRTAFQQEISKRDVPAERREDVQKLVDQRRQAGEVISHQTAAELLDGKTLKSRESELAKREKDLAERMKAIESGTISTREVPAPKDKPDSKVMTQGQYAQRMAKYRKDGETDKADALFLAVRRNEVELSG